jgi:cytochrome c
MTRAMLRPGKVAFGAGAILATIGVFASLSGASFASKGTVSGDPIRGAQTFAANCGACHSLDANRVGPALRGVYGRKAGTAPGYGYSPALAKSKIVWSAQMLDRWLQGPERVVASTRMRFRLADPTRRADVIAFLHQQGIAKPKR